ncbi:MULTISPECIES: helix-turn-helix domain-containing protein [Chryseobacterium]|uniref:helix-turn-helix domain-containing protein n=1 Tax=Chryseobacterium TaxID=59732 RepID=UPI00162A91C3|nr:MULTISPECIES: helix-turn-helix domain-containing protein [Chryseobacterium]
MFSFYLSDEGKHLLKSVIRETMQEFFEENQFNSSNEITAEQTGNITKDQFLTRKETSKLLKVSLVSLSNWQKSGILVPRKVGKRVLYSVEDVERALQKQNPNPKI